MSTKSWPRFCLHKLGYGSILQLSESVVPRLPKQNGSGQTFVKEHLYSNIPRYQIVVSDDTGAGDDACSGHCSLWL